MKIRYTILVLLFPFFSFCQEPIGKTINGLKEGEWILYDENKIILRKQNYKKGILDGDV